MFFNPKRKDHDDERSCDVISGISGESAVFSCANH